MTASAAQALVRQLAPADRRDLLSFLLSTLTDFAREYADDVLLAVADALDNLVSGASPLVRIAVGFGTKLLRFAADRIGSAPEAG